MMVVVNLIIAIFVWRKGWRFWALLPVVAMVVVSYALGLLLVDRVPGLWLSVIGWVVSIAAICVQIGMYQNPRVMSNH